VKHFVLALLLVAIGATPAPSPQPSPTAQQKLDQLQQAINSFAATVYAPICKNHDGLKTYAVVNSGQAWPARVWCNDGSGPIISNGPQP
jgi:hypothetical protein